MAGNQYSSFIKSAEGFVSNFESYREKKIVLYGLGQYTATLVSMARGFHFIGLMDGNEDNIGREIYGLKVISMKEAQNTADLIVINTSEFYWDLIFERISDIGIPVYFPNGKRAKKRKKNINKLSDSERNIDKEAVKAAVDKADIVSFDLYDTLLMRIVCSPTDVFRLTEIQLEQYFGKKIAFCEIRNKAIGVLCKENYTIEEIYHEMAMLCPNENVQLFKEMELKTEAAVTVGRKDVISIFRYAAEKKKEIYILSDMYLPSGFIQELMIRNGIEIDKEHIWVSGERGVSKNDKRMWKIYADEIVKDRKALHIGDSISADIVPAQEVGIQTIKIASALRMMEEIIPLDIWSQMNSLYSSITTGIVADEMFNSPFALNNRTDKFHIKTCRQFGKVIFGNMILTYLLWLLEESKKRGIKRLCFLSRDTYFIYHDFLKLVQMLDYGEDLETAYIFISRKAVLSLAAKEEEAFQQLLFFSYYGTFRDYLYDRFDITAADDDEHAGWECKLPEDGNRVMEWLKPYLKEIYEKIDIHIENYGKYISGIDWDLTATVDICYTGTIQYWLSKVLKKSITGFYCVANVSKNNPYKADNIMLSCFQRSSDDMAENSLIWKNHKIVESFLTAPYGMLKTVDLQGEFIFCENGNNQKYFAERELINDGCNEFISVYVSLLKKLEIKPEKIQIDPIYADRMFGNWFRGDTAYSPVIKKCFWHEDRFISAEKESRLF